MLTQLQVSHIQYLNMDANRYKEHCTKTNQMGIPSPCITLFTSIIETFRLYVGDIL